MWPRLGILVGLKIMSLDKITGATKVCTGSIKVNEATVSTVSVLGVAKKGDSVSNSTYMIG